MGDDLNDDLKCENNDAQQIDKNPGSDAAGVVGGYVTRIRYGGRDVKVRGPLPDSGAGT